MLFLDKIGRAGGIGPVGFHMGLENLHLLQMEKKQKICVRAADTIPYPVKRDQLFSDPHLFKDFVRGAFKKKNYRGKKIISCMPWGVAQIFPITFSGTAEPSPEAILKGAMPKLGGTPDQFVIDYIPIRSKQKDSGSKTILVVADRKESVVQYLDLLTFSGLDVTALDIGPAALQRLVVSLDRNKEYPSVLLINFCRLRSYITFISGRRLLLDRDIEYGESHFVEEIASSLSMAEEDALNLFRKYGLGVPEGGETAPDSEISQAVMEILKPIFLKVVSEVNKLLVYAASETRGDTVEKVYLIGSMARYPGVEEAWNRFLSIPTEILDPMEYFPPADSKGLKALPTHYHSNMAIAAGLALRGFY